MLAHIAMLLTASALSWMDDSVPPENAGADAISVTEEAKAPASPEALWTALQDQVEQLRRLQLDVESLRQELGRGRSVLVSARVVELDVTRLRALGFDIATDFQERFLGTASKGTGILDDSKRIDEFIKACEDNNIGRVLSEPAITTVCGRSASCEVSSVIPLESPNAIGSHPPQPAEGTRMDVLATSLGNERVRLDIRLRSTRRDERSNPPLRVVEVDTGVDLRSGQTFVLTSPQLVRNASVADASGKEEHDEKHPAEPSRSEKLMVVLVTPTFLPRHVESDERQASRPHPTRR